MALLSQKEYLDWARKAFAYVRENMTKGAGNRFIDQPDGYSKSEREQCVIKMREKSKDDILDARAWEIHDTRVNLRREYGFSGVTMDPVITAAVRAEAGAQTDMAVWGKVVDINAQYALEYGCGNCEEQSALTLKYLKDRGVKPLDWVKQEGFLGEFGNHAFVILGRDRKVPIKYVSAWNPEAVWCDPYENEMGGLDKITERFEGKDLSLLYRWGD
jgi:hypothetical protein